MKTEGARWLIGLEDGVGLVKRIELEGELEDEIGQVVGTEVPGSGLNNLGEGEEGFQENCFRGGEFRKG